MRGPESHRGLGSIIPKSRERGGPRTADRKAGVFKGGNCKTPRQKERESLRVREKKLDHIGGGKDGRLWGGKITCDTSVVVTRECSYGSESRPKREEDHIANGGQGEGKMSWRPDPDFPGSRCNKLLKRKGKGKGGERGNKGRHSIAREYEKVWRPRIL